MAGITREPGLASLIDMGSNIGKMWNFGFSGKLSQPSGWDFKNDKWSIGGMLSGPARFGTGALIGAGVGAMTDNPYAVSAGALIGGAAGWAAPALIGGASKLALKTAFGLGDIEWGLGKMFLGIPGEGSKGVMGKAIGAASDAIGGGAKLAGTGILKGAESLFAHGPVLNGLLNPSNLVKDVGEAEKGLAGVGFTGLGKAYISLGYIAGAVRDTWNADKKIRMGQVDPYLTKSTPRMPDYANNGGATGDLVFAMHKNRRG